MRGWRSTFSDASLLAMVERQLNWVRRKMRSMS
jgi:hypothetical protein